MMWHLSHRCDASVRPLADRHYSRQTVGAPGFVPPGRCLVLKTANLDAVWATSWPFTEYVKHAWAGAWMCSIFRNESEILASRLIVEAVQATIWKYGEPPELGMITFVDRDKVRPTKVRGKAVFGYCFIKAGFVEVGETKSGLLALQLSPEKMPAAAPPVNWQNELFPQESYRCPVQSK